MAFSVVDGFFYLCLTLVDLLDEEEFGTNAETINYDETSAKAAIELGLVVGNLTLKAEMLCVQFSHNVIL